MQDQRDHPVWEVYDLQRDCRLNFKYWSCVLRKIERQNFWLEVVIAAAAPGSAVAGLFFWKTAGGKEVWSLLTGATAVLSVAKPFFKFPDKLRNLHKVAAAYRSIELNAEALARDIRREKKYTAEMIKSFKRLELQAAEVSKEEPVDAVNVRLRNECSEEVMKELPTADFYLP